MRAIRRKTKAKILQALQSHEALLASNREKEKERRMSGGGKGNGKKTKGRPPLSPERPVRCFTV